jgi:hypothetical protein
MPSEHAFVVNGSVFYDPHPGVQAEVRQRLLRRVVQGAGPSKYFLRGNRGGGKSLLLRRGVAHALALALPGFRYVMVRRNFPDLESNHLIYLTREMQAVGGAYQEAKRMCRYPNGSIGFYRQCEEERDVEKIVGAEAALLIVDEAPQIPWTYLRAMAPSLRVAKAEDGSQPYWTLEVYSGNPMGESIEELDNYFRVEHDGPSAVEDPLYHGEDWAHVSLMLRDNPSVDPQEYLKQFAGLPPHYRAAWVDGARAENQVLFDVHKTKAGKPYHYIQELPTIDGVPLLQVPWVQIYRAFDMGYFPDPAVCVWLAVVGRRVIAVHEETWFRTIARDLAAKMREVTTELTGAPDCAGTFVDPQIAVKTGSDAVTVMDTLEMAGVPCEPSINDRVMYADAIHGLLGEEIEPGVPRLQIHEPGCPMLAKYLPRMRWDDKNARKMADHPFDHWIVTLAYFGISSGVLSLTAAGEAARQEPAWMAWMRDDAGRGRGGRRSGR